MHSMAQNRPLSVLMNRLGIRALIAAFALGWFIYLWGLGIPACLAGLSLGLMGQMLVTRFWRAHAQAHEEALRRACGGQLLLDALALEDPRRAHMAVTELLSLSQSLTPRQDTPDGMLAWNGRAQVLVACLAKHEKSKVNGNDVLAFMRACRAHRAEAGILCATCEADQAAVSWAAQAVVPVKIYPRSALLPLAGAYAPATDEQMKAMLSRRQPSTTLRGLAHRALMPQNARRFMLYGLGLSFLYILTGYPWYPGPALVCMALAALCRREKNG